METSIDTSKYRVLSLRKRPLEEGGLYLFREGMAFLVRLVRAWESQFSPEGESYINLELEIASPCTNPLDDGINQVGERFTVSWKERDLQMGAWHLIGIDPENATQLIEEERAAWKARSEA